MNYWKLRPIPWFMEEPKFCPIEPIAPIEPMEPIEALDPIEVDGIEFIDELTGVCIVCRGC